jgi:hypothetical protein
MMKVSFQLVAFKLSFSMYIFNGLMMAFYKGRNMQPAIRTDRKLGTHLKLRHVAGRKSHNLIQCRRVVRPEIKK